MQGLPYQMEIDGTRTVDFRLPFRRAAKQKVDFSRTVGLAPPWMPRSQEVGRHRKKSRSEDADRSAGLQSLTEERMIG